MKRIVCMMICLLITLLNVAVAETTEEIKFRGIEWGSTYAEVIEAFENEDVKWSNNPSLLPASSIENYACGGEDHVFSQNCSFMTASSNGGTHISVAGYDVKQIWLFLVATFENDALPLDIDHSALYLARYELKTIDSESSLQDLTDKLSSLYGEYEEYTRPGLFPEYSKIWRGANDTIVVLRRSSVNDGISISYAWKGAEELLQQANDYLYEMAAAEEVTTAEAAGTEGL